MLIIKMKKESLVIVRKTNLKFLKMRILKSVKKYNLKKISFKRYCILHLVLITQLFISLLFWDLFKFSFGWVHKCLDG